MAQKRQRKRPVFQTNSEIPMTPMIDIVFQLLIYFLVTFKPVDVMAHLDVFRPSPEAKKEQLDTPPNLIRVVIYEDGFTINEKPVDLDSLDSLLSKLAGIDRDQTILLMCTAHSPHEKLIQVLDLCAKSGLRNLSVVSMN
ncbi:MAG: biopolymer transporter ExbD [Verrucomicrobia bacterium]|nr:biopolymer transporter ExbD [Verrucomicrobiota bacterium]